MQDERTPQSGQLEAVISDELPRLLRLAQRLAPAELDASDLVQDTVERAWRSRATLQEPERAAAWLTRILVNRLRDAARRGGVLTFTSLEAVADPPDLTVQDPQALVETAERDAQLRAALRTLPENELLAVVLHDAEGWAAADVAVICGCSTAAAHKRIQRGRVRLTAALAHVTGSLPSPVDERCRAARELASGYLDGELDADQVREVTAHLSTCTACPPVLQALQGVVAALAAAPESAPPAELVDAVRAELRRYRQADAG